MEGEAEQGVQEVQVALVLVQALAATEALAAMEVTAAMPRLRAVWDITAALSAVEAHILISAH